jgi:hypothetical protein
MTSGGDLQPVLLVSVAVGVVGALLSRIGGSDPYGEIGGGELAMDVPDRVPAPRLDSEAGQEELRQLERALDDLRGRHGR